MDSHRKGDLTEALVIAELKQREIPVSVPFGDNERYDAVIETPDGALLKTQIKTGWLSDGVIEFHTTSQHTNSTGNVYKSYDGDIDVFLVYCYETERVYWVRESAFNNSIHLRVEKPKQVHDSINWAAEYELDNNWPPEDDSSEQPSRHIGKHDTVSAVIEGLQRKETTVFSPVNQPSHRFIVSTQADELYRIRAAAGTVVNGRIRFNSGRSATESNCAREKRSDDVDFFFVYCGELDTVYVVPSSEFDIAISLRVEEPKQMKSNINWAEDYEFDTNWPPE